MEYVSVTINIPREQITKITKIANEKYAGNFSRALRNVLDGNEEEQTITCPQCKGNGKLVI